MAKIKVLDLAREVGIEDDKLLQKLKRMGVKVKDKKPAEAEKIAATTDERIIERDADKEVVEKRVKPTIIRRRTRNLEPTVEAAPAPSTSPEVAPPAPPVTAEPPMAEGGAPSIATTEVRGESELKVSRKKGLKEEEERKEGEKLPPKVVGGGKKDEVPAVLPIEPLAAKPLTAEARGEEKVVAPPGISTGVEPPVTPQRVAERVEAKTKAQGTVPPKEAAPKKMEVRITGKIPIVDREEPPAAAKKKPFGKKRRIIEERVLSRDGLEEEDLSVKPKEGELEHRPLRPMKKKVIITRVAKKTEVTVPKPIKRIIRIAEVITVGDLAKRMGVKGGEIIRKLMDIGVMANLNQMIDADVASLVANDFGYEVEKTSIERQDLLVRKEDFPEQLKPRPPVVTVMGHVDHGKTMLLDAIRQTKVVEGEAGGITQHIGAYNVALDRGQVVFIDTPGHEAFTAMRARGAQVTDLVVLVVAADDGVMPQTKEAIDHARAANVPMVVAINKIDKPNANPEKVKKELSDLGLIPEKWGGSTLFAEVSAKQKIGIKELLELILLQAEVLELKANPEKPARGTVVEARLDKGRGPVATVLVQEGTLKAGDVFIAGSNYGRVRAIYNDKGAKMDAAGPSIPVEVVGFVDVPAAGEIFIVASDERMAKQISLYRQEKMREKELSKLSKVSLEQLYEQIKKGDVKELNVVIKADVQGSIEAIKEAIRKIATDAVKVNILHDSVGGITETDVNLASASNAVIIGFNVRPTPQAQSLAEEEKVDIRSYSVIYDATNDIKKALEGLLEPTYKEHILGRAQVLQLFNVRKIGMIAGSLVIDGKVVRGSHARLLRDNVVIFDGRIASLRRFKDDMKDCSQGFECGIWIENFNDVKPGDIIESYEMEEVRPRLS
jgi:translation initiation factor IF-2